MTDHQDVLHRRLRAERRMGFVRDAAMVAIIVCVLLTCGIIVLAALDAMGAFQ